MLFFDTTNQPTPLRELEYTVGSGGISPVMVQKGGVQGEHRATRLKFILDNSMKSLVESLLLEGRLFCRVDACDGNGVIHRSRTLELSGEFSRYSVFYYDIDQSITRAGGFVKFCLVLSLLNNNTTWAKIKSYYGTLELEASPTYSEEDFHDMTGLYEQTKAFAEQVQANTEATESARLVAEQSAQTAKASAAEVAMNVEAAVANASLAGEHSAISSAASAAAEAAAKVAEQFAADIKTAFEAVVVVSDEAAPSVIVQNNHEYRYTAPLTALTLELLTGLTEEDKFLALLTFKTVADADMVLTYSTADIDFTNDDCEEGVFVPLQNKMYDIAIYWNGIKYQGIVRGVAL